MHKMYTLRYLYRKYCSYNLPKFVAYISIVNLKAMFDPLNKYYKGNFIQYCIIVVFNHFHEYLLDFSCSVEQKRTG